MSLSSAIGLLPSITPGDRLRSIKFHRRSVPQIPANLRFPQIKHQIAFSPKSNSNPRRFSEIEEPYTRRSIVCSATMLDHETLQWISSISCLILMLARGTAIHKSFLAPLFVLLSPASVISWIRGDYGIFASFIALLVRLFFHIPGELELPFTTVLLAIVTPYQASRLRGSKIGAVIALVIAGYVAFQHFSRVGGLRKAFDQLSIVATLAIICIIVVPCIFLF